MRNRILVVPAKAGTHNHREKFCERSLLPMLHREITRVPGFAGTTTWAAHAPVISLTLIAPHMNLGALHGN
jgi:hypothetical protein